jgi:predicted Zn-dependent peptidase
VVDAFLFGALSDLADYDAHVRAVTPDGMRKLAERYFNPNRRVEGIVRGTGKRV